MPAAPPSVVASSASVDSQGNLKIIKVYVFCKTNMKGATFEVSKRETVGDLLGKIEQRQAAMLAGAKAGAFRSTAVVSTNLMTTFTGREGMPYKCSHDDFMASEFMPHRTKCDPAKGVVKPQLFFRGHSIMGDEEKTLRECGIKANATIRLYG